MNLFHQPDITEHTTQIIFDKEESRHLGKVLRKQEGDAVHVTNGKGFLFEGTLQLVGPKQCLANVVSVSEQAPLPYRLHLAVAPTKLNDRYEWFLEKATEIGIHAITPIICEHSERKVIKPERYEKILVSAMKQSLNMHLPVLHPAVSFSEFLAKQHTEELQCIAHCEETARTLLKKVLLPKQSTLLLIGPEGDFSEKEIDKAVAKEFRPVSLGTSRLRTETAAIVACHSVAFVNEED